MSKFVHRANSLPKIPADYVARWDSTTSDGMSFNTSEATGDLSKWVDQTGAYVLDKVNTNFPTWTPGKVTFGNDMGLQEITTALDAADMTLFFAASFDGTSGGGTYDYMVVAPNEVSIGNNGGIDEKYAFVTDADGLTIYKSTNDLTNTPTVLGCTNTHNGTDDNDKAHYVGNTALTTETGVTDAKSSRGYINVGWYLDATRSVTGDFYEMLIWDRVLTAAERTAVVDYLSNKWSAQNADSASESISAGSLPSSWINSSLDPDGEGEPLGNAPGKQTGEYSIQKIPDRDAPHPFASNKLDPAYPLNRIKGTVKYWFDAAVTDGMTFATGDAASGGTVSSWVDITGSVTMDTTTSGDSAVDYNPTVLKGRPSISGGTSGSPKSLESTANISYSTIGGRQRLFWAVINIPTSAGDQAPCGWFGNILFPSQHDVYDGDIYSGVNHPSVYVGSATTGVNKQPASVADVSKGFHILVCRTTINGTNGDVESWYCGFKGPDRVSSSADAGAQKCSVGALSTSNYDSDGHCFEFGAVDGDGANGVSDSEVDDLIRYLCAKYEVDYMPDTTPMDIGLVRSTTTVAQTDTCLWFRSDKGLSENGWTLHPLCAALHTTPENLRLEPYSTGDPSFVETQLGRKVLAPRDTSPVTSLVGANNYDFNNETTDFPGTDGGASTAMVVFHDSATATSSGSQAGTGASFTRFSGTSDTVIQHLASNSSSNWPAAGDKWNLFGVSYLYDDDGSSGEVGVKGVTDGTPYYWKWNHDDAPIANNAGAATNFVTNFFVGSGTTGALQGLCRTPELFAWKHALQQWEIDNLKKYIYQRYEFDPELGPIYLHEEDANTVAHWTYETDLSDNTATKSDLDVGTYVAAGEEALNRRQVHNHTAQTTEHGYSAQDADLDTLGAFTWAAAVYVTALAGSNPAPAFVRSETPGGGVGSADNIRYRLETRSGGELRYIHQYGTKQSETYSTTATLPLNRWVYVAVSRAANGLSGRIMINETIEEFTMSNAPANGSSARYRMWSDFEGDDLDAYVSSVIFKDVETSAQGLMEMRRQVFPHSHVQPPVGLSVYKPIYSGDASNVVFGTSPAIAEMVNQVPKSLITLPQSSPFQPTQVTVNSKLAFHCGSGSGLDQFLFNTDGVISDLSDLIQDDQWHVFTVVRFDAITAASSEDPGFQHLLFGGFNNTTTGGHFALTLHDDTGTDYAQGFANNGTSDVTVRTAYPVSDSDYHLIEFWNTGSEMGIRLDDGSEVTTAWTGNIPAGSPGMANDVRVGSINFEGGWDATTNVMAELHVFDRGLTDAERVQIRNILASRGYGFSV